MYQNSYEIFKEINPKRYSKLTFYDVPLKEAFLYLENEMVIRLKEDGKFYMYKGTSHYVTSTKEQTEILFNKGKKTIHSIKYL